MIGEIGGSAEEEAAEFLAKAKIKKPRSASSPASPRLPAAAWVMPAPIISGGKGKAEDKIEAMRSAGIRVSPNPAALGTTLKELLNSA